MRYGKQLILLFVFVNLVNTRLLAEETVQIISEEDLEIVKNLEFLQNMEILENSDMSLLENYDDVDNLSRDEGGNNANKTIQ